MKAGFLSLALILVAGCSSNPSADGSATAKAAQADDPGKGIICTYEKPTGSFLKEKRCTTPEQREAERLNRDVTIDHRGSGSAL